VDSQSHAPTTLTPGKTRYPFYLPPSDHLNLHNPEVTSVSTHLLERLMGPRIICGMDVQKELCDLAGNRTRSKLPQCKSLLVELYWLQIVFRQYTRCSVLQWSHNLYSQRYQLLTFLLKFLSDVPVVNSLILLITFANFVPFHLSHPLLMQSLN
jgi:hypothetical protein